MTPSNLKQDLIHSCCSSFTDKPGMLNILSCGLLTWMFFINDSCFISYAFFQNDWKKKIHAATAISEAFVVAIWKEDTDGKHGFWHSWEEAFFCFVPCFVSPGIPIDRHWLSAHISMFNGISRFRSMSNYSIPRNCCSGKSWKNCNFIFGRHKHICHYGNTMFMFCLRKQKSMVKKHSSHADIHYILGVVDR